MSDMKDVNYVMETRADKSVNIKDYSITTSISPKVDEVYIEKEEGFYTIYLTDETGSSIELNMKEREFNLMKRAMDRIAKMEGK